MASSDRPSSLKFGTSGLRGLVIDLDGPPANSWTRAFVEMLREDGALKDGTSPVYIGRDLRFSSPAIAARVADSVRAAGFLPVDCGALPTPALALAAMGAGAPAVMVTGSHIPDDRNGLKFYRASGEIDKSDEGRILAHHARVLATDPASAVSGATAQPPAPPIPAYIRRYTEFFASNALSGLKVGVYQHSSVARDVMGDVVAALGASVIPLGRATAFIPVDTEAVRDEDRALAEGWAGEHGFDALISTDGDADRPLMADAAGHFLRGDLLGVITARHLDLDTIVTPVTSNERMEESGGFKQVVRTKVGSPFVIAGMESALQAGGRVLGFEANGGALLGSDVTRDGRHLPALQTRDALLPILCALSEIAAQKKPLKSIVAGFGFNEAASTRVENCAQEKSGAFLASLSKSEGAAAFFAAQGGVRSLSTTDGLRFTLSSGDVVHFRASGNAPELRVYVEAQGTEQANAVLAWAYAAAVAAMG